MNDLTPNSPVSKQIIAPGNIVRGMRVQDIDNNRGTVTQCDDVHNIVVEYDNGGSGFHCLVEDCVETTTINDQLIDIPHYDPLYYCE